MSRNSKQKAKQNSINGNVNRALESNVESKVENPPSPLIHNPSHINDQCFHIVSPLIFSTELSKLANCQVWLKLENLQPAGSHKVRGIGAYCLRQYNLGITQFYCSEGSNSCIATAYIGRQLECKVTAIVPENCSKHILALLKVHHAEILKYGTSWEDATLQAKTLQMHNPDSCFVSSYDHADIWEGNKSIITEIGKQIGDTPVGGVVLGVGGGGLLSGVVMGMEEAGLENVPIVAVETHGCNSLQQSVYAEKVLTLQMSNTKAESLAQRRVCSKAFESCFAHPVIPVSVSDNMAANGIVQFATQHNMLVEIACGAVLSIVYKQLINDILPNLTQHNALVIVISGGNYTSPEMVSWFRKKCPNPPVFARSGTKFLMALGETNDENNTNSNNHPSNLNGVSNKAAGES